MQENKENLRSYSNTNSFSPENLKIGKSPSKNIYRDGNDSTILEESWSWCHQSDATFESMERMCNKTLSDPNNTIHEYLANLEKNENTGDNVDEEIETINRLFTDYGININDSKFANQTQLNEVEPPSCLWENTVNNESSLQISPVKMVGHLRPSTILEESASDSLTSTNSYKSAQPVSSDQYETANDSNHQSIRKDVIASSEASCSPISEVEQHKIWGDANSTVQTDDCNTSETSKSSASVYFDLFPLRKRQFYDEGNEPRLYHKTIFLADTSKINSKKFDESTTDMSSPRSSDTSHGISSLSIDSLDKSEHRSSEMIDDSLNIASRSRNQDSGRTGTSVGYKKRSHARKSLNNSSKLNNSSIISVSDDETIESDELNKGFVDESNNTRDESTTSFSYSTNDMNVSHEFNDTLEEIEYFMEQGMKYLNDKQATPRQVQTPKFQKTPSCKASPKTPCTVISKPQPTSTSSQKKSLSLQSRARFGFCSKNMPHFEHIMSPVRAYIRNTPISPITTLMKPSQNIFETKMARESRPYANNSPTLETEKKSSVCSLPRKAYVSAQYQHVVDQRSPISIPGGDKIHRYLEPSFAASVLRHEGKYKINMTAGIENDLTTNKEGTLADFSLASGDMSVLLLRDAKDLGK